MTLPEGTPEPVLPFKPRQRQWHCPKAHQNQSCLSNQDRDSDTARRHTGTSLAFQTKTETVTLPEGTPEPVLPFKPRQRQWHCPKAHQNQSCLSNQDRDSDTARRHTRTSLAFQTKTETVTLPEGTPEPVLPFKPRQRQWHCPKAHQNQSCLSNQDRDSDTARRHTRTSLAFQTKTETVTLPEGTPEPVLPFKPRQRQWHCPKAHQNQSCLSNQDRDSDTPRRHTRTSLAFQTKTETVTLPEGTPEPVLPFKPRQRQWHSPKAHQNQSCLSNQDRDSDTPRRHTRTSLAFQTKTETVTLPEGTPEPVLPFKPRQRQLTTLQRQSLSDVQKQERGDRNLLGHST